MSFLVILICLMINYLWLKDFDRFDDGWFFKLRSKVESFSKKESAQEPDQDSDNLDKSWILNLLMIYGIPFVFLFLCLMLVAESFFGIPTMLVHILVLLVAFDRTQPGQLAREFLAKWREGDIDGCSSYLQKELAVSGNQKFDSEEALSDFFKKQLVYRCFEKMFVMFFWYMLTGPLGILISYVSYQMRDSHRADQPKAEVEFVNLVIRVLEWVPLRLLAITFSLAGNFVRCFDRVKESFWDFTGENEAADLLIGYASCALSGTQFSDQTAADDADSEPNQEGSAEDLARELKAQEIQALQGLLERSQAIWLSVLALITIFGLQAA